MHSRSTDAVLNGALCAHWVEGGRHASSKRLLEKGRKWVAMLNYGACKRRSATNPGSISIYRAPLTTMVEPHPPGAPRRAPDPTLTRLEGPAVAEATSVGEVSAPRPLSNGARAWGAGTISTCLA